MKNWVYFFALIMALSACSKPPELEAPCHQFGKHCAQYPINESPLQEMPR